jgi:Spy/CpxP family protein refolding chaperone
MFVRQMLSCTVVSGIFLAYVATTYADKSHDGKVVSVSEGAASQDGKLVMADKDGKNEHNHAISSSVKIMRDGKSVKLGDLKKGDAITVTMADDGKVTALAAKENTANGSPGSNKGPSNSSGDGKKSTAPDMLKNLKLTSDQQAKIDDITKKYDDQCETTWKEFSDSYQRAIRMEASMLAAIEDHFNDAQRKQVREQRHRMGRHKHHDGKADAKTDTKTAVKATPDAASKGAQEEEIVIIGISLSPQQEENAHHVRRHFFDRLNSVNQDIERLHAKMISLETEKLTEIEEVLTNDQREQLRKEHESLSSKPADSSGATTK